MLNLPFLARPGRHRAAFAEPARLRQETPAFPGPENLGSLFPPYRPIFEGSPPFVDAGHAELAALPEEGGLLKAKTPGFLRPADALLLYELAWHAAADVIEIGSAWGLSASILCQAAGNAGRGVRVTSVEIDPAFQRATRDTITALGLSRHFDPRPGPARSVLQELIAERRQFSFAFVDHDHSSPAVSEASHQLSSLLLPGGVAVFHDFNDERNVSEPDTYGVHAAIAGMVRRRAWRYLGVLGCCAVVQRTTT